MRGRGGDGGSGGVTMLQLQERNGWSEAEVRQNRMVVWGQQDHVARPELEISPDFQHFVSCCPLGRGCGGGDLEEHA